MTTHSVRFGVGDPFGLRSSEWAVIWKSDTSDVYLAGRTLGGSLKVSLHESGRCHVRAPDQRHWLLPGSPPRFIDSWTINPKSNYEFPFGVIIPSSELRRGPWMKHKNKKTVWIPTKHGKSVEIAVFLTRSEPRPLGALASAGWTTKVVLERLSDGRDLWVVAGETIFPEKQRNELEIIKANIRPLTADLPSMSENLRLLLVATDDNGTRRFVEAAVNERDPTGHF